ncbi:hypothetical protein HPP92_020330 [Vanilla planifolia]|uniref:F-box domain-containing protein n=1 Tax=Vanilla planifolia TaxID=51239 RepID=A0A835ULY9_VANPL|nr:hypothetical protein HPP92_020330 [Vanilla planifolia]
MENQAYLPAGGAAEPHGALYLVLSYLRLPELLAFRQVCRAFRDEIATDELLWRHITVAPPLSGKLTDDILSRITSLAKGKLSFLELIRCWRITDAGLLQVVQQNLAIIKLYLPGCTCITADGVVRVVKLLVEQNGCLKRLRIHGIFNIKGEHLIILRSLLCKNLKQECSSTHFYSYCQSPSINGDDEPVIDVDVCPKCKNVRMVFDCTRENCRAMRNKLSECRGCFFCIARCEECGGCLAVEELEDDTACFRTSCALPVGFSYQNAAHATCLSARQTWMLRDYPRLALSASNAGIITLKTWLCNKN